MNIAQKISDVRAKLDLTQAQFAERIGFSRNYISRLETGTSKNPSRKFLKELEQMEAEARVHTLHKQTAHYIASGSAGESNVDLRPIKVRKIPVLSFAQAGRAVDFETHPDTWEGEEDYDGTDEKAFALRVAGDSMEPRFPPGTIITVSPAHPPTNGDLVVAVIKNEGAVFKLFFHSGDGKTVTLKSYNPLYEPIIAPREKFHYILKVVRSSQSH